jgi:PPOX class probable F420-dependent enzyme
MTATTLLDLGDEPFVLLTTFRRSGERVSTPVWVARDGDHLVVITPAGTGKVKRIAANTAVEVTPCDRRGRPKPWASTLAGRAEVRESAADSEAAREAIKAKYRREFRIFMAIEKVARRMKEPRRVAVWIGPADG